MSEHNSAAVLDLLDGCLQGNRRSQELLYKQFYGYAMGLCLRYTRNREEAREILNEGFFKIFTKLESFDRERPFKIWMGRIMINTALDQYRREIRNHTHENIENVGNVSMDENIISRLSYEDLIGIVQQLPPAYRTVFCMAVLDGYTHEEIATELNITVGSSKSNLARAREKLRVMLSKKSFDEYERVVR
jgi:RNA polymerase sigma factor (sigma-70 family)